MKDKKKKLITIISVAVLAVLFIIYLVTLKVKNNNEIVVERLLDEDTFYKIQTTINNYISTKDYTTPEYTLKNVYFREEGNTRYYHANGYIVDYFMEDYTYEKNVNFLLVVKGNSYNLYELTSLQNESYLEEINLNDYAFKDGEVFDDISYNEEGKLTSYISEFVTLLSIDNSSAYQLLTTDMKNKYRSYTDFSEKSYETFDKLNTTITKYDKTNQDIMTIYTITTENGNTIKIYELCIGEFKIEY